MLERTKADDVLLLLARVAVGLLFIPSGFRKLMDINAFAASLEGRGVPMPEFMAWVGGLVEFVAGIAVLVGVQMRAASLLLILFTVLATLIAHRFWEFQMPARQLQQSQFFKNVAIIGAFMALYVAGSGRYALERLWRGADMRRVTPGRRAADQRLTAYNQR